MKEANGVKGEFEYMNEGTDMLSKESETVAKEESK